jgi:hypothetical protein
VLPVNIIRGYAAEGAATAYMLTVVLILGAAVVAAVVLLVGIELIKLVWWKLRRCPTCHRRLAFPGWDWGEWHNRSVRQKTRVRGKPKRETWACVICPHCAYSIPARRVVPFSSAA